MAVPQQCIMGNPIDHRPVGSRGCLSVDGRTCGRSCSILTILAPAARAVAARARLNRRAAVSATRQLGLFPSTDAARRYARPDLTFSCRPRDNGIGTDDRAVSDPQHSAPTQHLGPRIDHDIIANLYQYRTNFLAREVRVCATDRHLMIDLDAIADTRSRMKDASDSAMDEFQVFADDDFWRHIDAVQHQQFPDEAISPPRQQAFNHSHNVIVPRHDCRSRGVAARRPFANGREVLLQMPNVPAPGR